LEELRRKVTEAYDACLDPRYAAARGWVDEIVEPAETRKVLIESLEIATRHSDDEPFRTGVLQV
jgi:3-methylcrotonyl-CoA carboxylase beta subunit